MATEKKPRSDKYQEKQGINASFMDVIKLAVKPAKGAPKPKKK